jgi:hypothetical protein
VPQVKQIYLLILTQDFKQNQELVMQTISCIQI